MKNSTIKFLATVILMTVISLAVKSQTHVKGGIYSNTTWTKAKSPYIVDSNVVVFPGKTLTIEPGVKVMFANKVSMEIRQANLYAVGTITDSITFTSNSSKPVVGIWGQITIGIGNGDASTAEFSYSNFKYGAASLGGNSAVLYTVLCFRTTKNPNIKHCSFYKNGGSGYASGGIASMYSQVTIDSCSFINNNMSICNANEYTGYFIVNNSIFNNNNYGCYLNDGGSLENCFFSNNVTGVNGGTNIINCKILNNHNGIISNGATIMNDFVAWI